MSAYRRIGVSAYRRTGVAAWRRGGVAAWRRGEARAGAPKAWLRIAVSSGSYLPETHPGRRVTA
jgi:hypothetical protein